MRRLLVTSGVVLLLASAASGQVSTGRVPGPLMSAPSPGTVMGYVYWDGNAVKHSPANDCGGLSVTVSAGGAALGTFSTGHFAYIPNSGTFSVCAYTVNQMPVGQNLQVRVNVTAPAAFSPAVAVSGAGAINIMGGSAPCNNLPPAVPSAADLSRNWWTCPNYAYNVNFVLAVASGLAGANRMAVGTVPPGAAQTANSGAQGTLLAPGGQKTLLGTQANSPTSGGNSGAAVPQQTASAGGSLSGGAQAGSGTLGPSQTMSATRSSAGSQTSSLQSVTAATTPSVASSPGAVGKVSSAGVTSTVSGAYVAAACAKDPTFRILGVSGTPDGVTLTAGQQYTISGCSFGDTLHAKAPAVPHGPVGSTGSVNTTQVPNTAYLGLSNHYSFECGALGPGGASFRSWSDNSILMALAPDTGWNCPATLYVRRADGQTTSIDGFRYETPPPPPPPAPPATPELAAQSCSQDNTFRVIGVYGYPTSGSGPVGELRPYAYYTIAGCSFGSAGPQSNVAFQGPVFDSHVPVANSKTTSGLKTIWCNVQAIFPFTTNSDHPFATWENNSIVIWVGPLGDVPPCSKYVNGNTFGGTFAVTRGDGNQAKQGISVLFK